MRRTTRRDAVVIGGFCAFAALAMPQQAQADAGGVSFWLPGTFGSLAADPGRAGMGLRDDLPPSAAERRRVDEFRDQRRCAGLGRCRPQRPCGRSRRRRHLHLGIAGLGRPGGFQRAGRTREYRTWGSTQR